MQQLVALCVQTSSSDPCPSMVWLKMELCCVVNSSPWMTTTYQVMSVLHTQGESMGKQILVLSVHSSGESGTGPVAWLSQSRSLTQGLLMDGWMDGAGNVSCVKCIC